MDREEREDKKKVERAQGKPVSQGSGGPIRLM